MVTPRVPAAAGRPLILLLFNAGPLNVSWAQGHDGVGAILACFFPAQATGLAITKVLLGEQGANPAGRLPATWPAGMHQVRAGRAAPRTPQWSWGEGGAVGCPLQPSPDAPRFPQVPPMENYTMEGRTYRYYGQEAPLYPFGYGLSYTTFQYRDLVLSPPLLPVCANLSVSVVLENTGQRDGEEVSVAALKGTDRVGVPSPDPPPCPYRWCSSTCAGSSPRCRCPAGSWWLSAAWPCRLAGRPSCPSRCWLPSVLYGRSTGSWNPAPSPFLPAGSSRASGRGHPRRC